MLNRKIGVILLCVALVSNIAFAGEETKKPPQGSVAEPAPAPQAAPESAPSGAAQPPAAQPPAAQSADTPASVADQGAEGSDEKVDAGNVTVNFKGADIRTVLAYISDVAAVDIVPAPEVKGVVDLKLTNKPWKVALDIIVRNYGFAYERDGDIIRIVTIDKLKQEELSSEVFALNYSKGQDVVGSIKDLVSDRGKVICDERTNTVVITDIPTNIYKIKQVIERLDKKTIQVLITARIIETVLGKDERMGIDWNVKATISGAKRPFTAPFSYYGDNFNYLKKYEPLVQVGTTTVTATAAGNVQQSSGLYPTGAQGNDGANSRAFPLVDYTQEIFKDTFTFGSLDFTEFSAVLEMLKQRSNTEIVSNPRILTLNNNQASINVGQTLNLPTYERSPTTGKMEVTGYEAKDLGILLTVTPHVNDNGEIVVDLAPEISDLLRYDTLDAASGIVAPVFSMRTAKTQVMIRDGDTVFIGGLIKENDLDVRKKLPIIGDLLGDIPYLGLLVSKKETAKQKTELIFFITVNLMTAGKDLEGIPKADKVYVPRYTGTPPPEDARKKRMSSKRF